ncbi:MAG: hypothetical protein INR71_01045 [Terriglobus roseus]|nr:hypothetical protein [Terriglobus roseus]
MGDAQLFEHRTTPSHAAVGHTTRAFSVSQGSLFAQSRGAALSSEVRRRASPPSSTPPRRRPSHSTSLATISGNARSPAEPPSIVVHGARKNATLADEKGTRRSDPPTPIKVPPTYGQLDGKAQPPGHGASGNTPVTSATMANTAGKMSQPLAPRPPLISQQSNSVPSTPHQHAREFISRSRSPSPHAPLAGSHSPRSVKSEANGYMAALPRGRPTCKYETAAAFGKRRILYDIGDAPLEKLTDAPKATLNPDEEDKLSGDMRELYDRLLPTHESEQRRVKLVDKLDSILRKEWPGSDFTVNIFGSSGNMLCTTESDGGSSI